MASNTLNTYGYSSQTTPFGRYRFNRGRSRIIATHVRWFRGKTSRLEPIPKPPVTTTVEQTRPQLNQQQQEAEDQVATERPEDPQFYPMGQTAVAPAPTLNTAKSPEQLAAEQAARNRAMALLNGTDGASVEEAPVSYTHLTLPTSDLV